MFLVSLYLLVPILIPPILLFLSMNMSEWYKEDFEKSSPFECGFDPLCPPRSTLTVRFYLMAIIFLIFDVEIVLVLPMIISKPQVDPFFWMITIITFIVILILGLLYEWWQGTFNWSNY